MESTESITLTRTQLESFEDSTLSSLNFDLGGVPTSRKENIENILKSGSGKEKEEEDITQLLEVLSLKGGKESKLKSNMIRHARDIVQQINNQISKYYIKHKSGALMLHYANLKKEGISNPKAVSTTSLVKLLNKLNEQITMPNNDNETKDIGIKRLFQMEWNISDKIKDDKGQIQMNFSKYHDNLMALIQTLFEAGLYIIGVEVPVLCLGDMCKWIIKDNSKDSYGIPLGIIDMLCIDVDGKYVVCDIKTTFSNVVENPKGIGHIINLDGAFQTEVYAGMYEEMSKKLPPDERIEIAYNVIIGWSGTTKKEVDGKGKIIAWKIDRNPDLYLRSKGWTSEYRIPLPITMQEFQTRKDEASKQIK